MPEITTEVLRRAAGGITLISQVQGAPLRNGRPTFANPSRDELRQSFFRWFQVPYVSEFRSDRFPGEHHPYLSVATRDGGLYLFLSGVQDRNQFPRVAQGYATTYGNSNRNPGWNAYASGFAESLIRAIRPVAANLRYLEIYGHSLGGMIAELMALLARDYQIDVRQLHTYGSPKAAVAGLYVLPHQMQRWRWMADGDPVPLLPYGRVGNLAEYLLATQAIVTSGRRIDVTQWRHPGPGIAIGDVELRESLEPRGLVNPATVLDEWIAGRGGRDNAHEAEHYRALLVGWYDAQVEPTTGPARPARLPNREPGRTLVMPFELPTAPRLTPDLVMPFVLNSQVELVPQPPIITVDARTGRTSTGLVLSPVASRSAAMANGKLASNAGFVRVKTPGYGWVVYLRGTMVAATTSGSRAKTMVRRGNALIRYMGNLAWTSGLGDAWSDALAAYMAGDGYTPPIEPAT